MKGIRTLCITCVQILLLFTLLSVTRLAMHRIYANHINSRRMSRDFGIFMPKHLAG